MKQKTTPARFPLRRQLAGLYGYELTSCIDITTAVWVALLAARGYSLWQIGLAEGVHHIVSLAAEIPSGMAADLLGPLCPSRPQAAGGGAAPPNFTRPCRHGARCCNQSAPYLGTWPAC